MLEVVFWAMWGYVVCEGPLVVKLYETASNTNLSSSKQNTTLLLDDEGAQILQDSAALWILITMEVLELERIAKPDGVEISSSPKDKSFYISSPESLKQIHTLVMSHSNSQHACAYLAWAFVLSRLHAKAQEVKDVLESYRLFLQSTLVHPRHGKDCEPTHTLMA